MQNCFSWHILTVWLDPDHKPYMNFVVHDKPFYVVEPWHYDNLAIYENFYHLSYLEKAGDECLH